MLEGATYGKLAGELGVNKGTLWKVVNTDYVPKDAALREKFGFPESVSVDIGRTEDGEPYLIIPLGRFTTAP